VISIFFYHIAIVLMLTIISCCLSAHFTINNDIVIPMSPDEADRMFLV
jgi:hypothetical protein